MENKIDLAATRLAIAFAEEINLPSRFKKDSQKRKKQKPDSAIELRFKRDVEHWKFLINNMFDRIDNSIAWRFINIDPKIDKPDKSEAYQQDFSDFIDYLVLRRDKENCSPEELGRLAALSSEFQNELKKQLNI